MNEPDSYYQDNSITIYCGDCREILKELPEKSIHCCVTSPPYWGLRDYGIGKDQLGLEPTPELYVQHLVEIFREVKRVLRDDGTVWLNMGDSYNTNQGGNWGKQHREGRAYTKCAIAPYQGYKTNTLKPKDLIGIPWRVAFALQADGWYLRSDIIWAKPNPMPESVTDRPTKAHEYVFLLSKKQKYYYDADAVREPQIEPNRINTNPGTRRDVGIVTGLGNNIGGRTSGYNPAGRNKRTVWETATQPFPEAHFAVFPEKLIEPCILAGTSEKGCCPECGSPWERIIKKEGMTTTEKRKAIGYSNKRGDGGKLVKQNLDYSGSHGNNIRDSQTIGWQPTCNHNHNPIPCTVLDLFAGAGTVGAVAKDNFRKAILIDIKQEYCEMAIKRVKQEVFDFGQPSP